MSAFDEWYSSKIMWRDERSIPKNLMQEAFNAGLEAAAVYVNQAGHTGGNVFEQLASNIRALKE